MRVAADGTPIPRANATGFGRSGGGGSTPPVFGATGRSDDSLHAQKVVSEADSDTGTPRHVGLRARQRLRGRHVYRCRPQTSRRPKQAVLRRLLNDPQRRKPLHKHGVARTLPASAVGLIVRQDHGPKSRTFRLDLQSCLSEIALAAPFMLII